MPSNTYTLWRIITDGGGQPRISKQTLAGDFGYFLPPLAPQRQGDVLDTGDTRVMQAAFRDGEVWATHATACGIGQLPNESCVRAVRISPVVNSAMISFQETFGRPNMFMFWPGIAVNRQATSHGVPALHAQRVHGCHVQRQTGQQHALRRLPPASRKQLPARNFQPGLGANRTGDYVGLQTDPLDDLSFWVAGEYTSQVNPVLGCDWKTRIGRARY